MIRGTTAQFKFQLPYKVSEVDVVKITFWQNNYYGPTESRPLPIVKVLSQCSEVGTNELLVFLNKEETLRFSDDRKAYVQMQGKTKEGIAFASRQQSITVYPVYDDSVLDDEVIPTPGPNDDDFIVLDGSIITNWG